MLETLDQHFISGYAAGLRRELIVQGFKDGRVEEVVAEATTHLEEAMAAGEPQSASEVNRVLKQFGSASTMARKLAADELNSSRRKWFLWPMLFIPPAIYVSMNPLPQTRVLHDSLWIGTFYMLISAAALFLMGTRVRRPLLGQFAALVFGMIVCQVGWYAATSYPVAYGPAGRPEWYAAVPRSGYDREISAMNNYIVQEREVVRRVILGQHAFAQDSPPAKFPGTLKYEGMYWLPEGVREVAIGVSPAKVNRSLLTATWSDARSAWVGDRWIVHMNRKDEVNPVPMNPAERRDYFGTSAETEAERIRRQISDEIAQEHRATSYLTWVRTQPLSVQLLADYRMVSLRSVVFVGLGALCTNAGWIAWMLFRMLSRLRRRIFYRADGLRAA